MVDFKSATRSLDKFFDFDSKYEHDVLLDGDDDFFNLIGAKIDVRDIGSSQKKKIKTEGGSENSKPSSSIGEDKALELFQTNDIGEKETKEESSIGQSEDKLETNNEALDPNEKSIVKGKKPFLMCIFGKPGEGKSALAQYVVYEKFQQKAVDYVMVISNSSFNDDWKWLPPKAIKKLWTKELAEQITKFQSKKGRGHLLVVLEDPVGSFPWDDKQVIQMIIMHRHLNISWIINVQYVNKLPPIYRECATYVAIFKQQTDRSKEALYLSYGGDFSNKKEFYELLNQSTGNYYFLFFEAPFQRWSKTKITPLSKGVQIKF
jgi:hypothetical protein